MAFQIGEHLVAMCEQQSTPNMNMPLRLLSYAATGIYAKYLQGAAIFGSSLIKIPTPRLYVLYNGREPYPEKELRLSAAYMVRDDQPCIEVVAKVVNIRYLEGTDSPVLKQSKSLNGYARLVHEIDSNLAKGLGRDEALRAAVNECVRLGDISDFLSANLKEVLAVLTFEYDKELDMLAQRNEGRA